MLDLILSITCWTFWSVLAISVLTYLIPIILQTFTHKPQDLKKKYGASWALVTGGSSGIGRGLCEHLAKQGLNIVIVALQDSLLDNFHEKITKDYPNQQFRKVGVDLSKYEAAFEQIQAATNDIDVQIIFNNAGYITFGLFNDVSLQRHMNNYHVNSTIAVMITHHFAQKLIQKKLKGCISFTSSPAGQMPGPMAALYGATKAFLTNFGSSVACEYAQDGIDVLVMHPSPVDTNFYTNDSAKNSSSLAFFRKTAAPPTAIAGDMIANIGRPGCVIRNQGYFANSLNLILKIVDFSFMSIVMKHTIGLSGEYKKMRKKN